MQDFRVYFKIGSDDILLDIPDIYREPESETTTYQLVTYISKELNVDFYDLDVDIKRNGRIKKKCNDYVIETEDIVYIYLTKKDNKIDISKISMNAGFFNNSERVSAKHQYKESVLNSIIDYDDRHMSHVNEVVNLINAFVSKVVDDNDKLFIKNLVIMNCNIHHTTCYPFSKVGNKYYFCNFEDGEPKGLGYMFDFDTNTYYQGQFLQEKIYHGKSFVMKDDESHYNTCLLYVNGIQCQNGFRKYFFRNEIYSGSFVDGTYFNNGYLSTDEGVYDGKFRFGLKSVLGYMKYSNGDEYIGYWSQGKKSFHGKMIYSNGDHYIGTWYDDKKEEFGLYYDSIKDVTYVGTFSDDKRTFNENEYKVYCGNYQFSSITGAYEIELNDKIAKVNKTCYDKENLLLASSKTIPNDKFDLNQMFYTGTFDFMKRFYGYGRLLVNPDKHIIVNNSNKEVFTREHIEDKFENFQKYFGIFNENKLNGFGMVIFRNGDRYIGEFTDNHQNGNGLLLKKDGRREFGYWNMGKFKN